MFLSILSATVCFVTAIIMLTPYFRKISLLTPMALYLVFEGIMQLLTYIILDVFPANRVIIWVNYIGSAVILLYYCFVLIMTKSKSKKKKKDEKGKKN